MGSRNSTASRGAGMVQQPSPPTSQKRPEAPERVTYYPAPQDENGAVYGLDNLARVNRAQLMLDGLKNLMYLLADARKVPAEQGCTPVVWESALYLCGMIVGDVFHEIGALHLDPNGKATPRGDA